MSDPLRQVLLDRALATPAPAPSTPTTTPPAVQPPGGMPTVTPSKPQHLPPAWQRWMVSQKMQQAYRNGWEPNPMLIQAAEGSK
jgi:hypothetical protein